jgi:hypothetical protein
MAGRNWSAEREIEKYPNQGLSFKQAKHNIDTGFWIPLDDCEFEPSTNPNLIGKTKPDGTPYGHTYCKANVTVDSKWGSTISESNDFDWTEDIKGDFMSFLKQYPSENGIYKVWVNGISMEEQLTMMDKLYDEGFQWRGGWGRYDTSNINIPILYIETPTMELQWDGGDNPEDTKNIFLRRDDREREYEMEKTVIPTEEFFDALGMNVNVSSLNESNDFEWTEYAPAVNKQYLNWAERLMDRWEGSAFQSDDEVGEPFYRVVENPTVENILDVVIALDYWHPYTEGDDLDVAHQMYRASLPEDHTEYEPLDNWIKNLYELNESHDFEWSEEIQGKPQVMDVFRVKNTRYTWTVVEELGDDRFMFKIRPKPDASNAFQELSLEQVNHWLETGNWIPEGREKYWYNLR